MKTVKLPEICTIPITDGTHQTPTYATEQDGIPFISSKDVTSKKIDWKNIKYITKELHEQLYKRIAPQKDDLLLAKNGTTGVAALVEDDKIFDIYVTLAVIRPDLEKVFPKYLFHVINSPFCKNQFNSHLVGIGVPNLHLKDINQTEIPLPTLSEQQKIATELDTIQSAIDNKKQQLSLLDESVKSEFVEMFGNPITNSKKFPTKKVIDVVTLQRGYDLPVQDRDSTGNIPVFGSNGILGTHNVAKINKGVVTGRSGTIGEVYLCDEPFWPLNTTLFSNDTHGNNLCYLKYLLEFFDLKRFKSGVGVPTLNRNEFHDEPIIDVPLELQNKFATFVQQINKSKIVVKKQVENLKELLDYKMDKYFGE